MRLPRDVFQHGSTLCGGGGEHGVHGSAYRHGVKKHMAAHQAIRLDADLPIFHRILCPEGGKGLEVLVDGARTQIAAAGHSDLTGAEPPQQCAKEVVAGTHLARQFVGNLGAVDVGGVDLVNIAGDHTDVGTQLA